MSEHKSASPSDPGDKIRERAKASHTSESGPRISQMGDDFVSNPPQSEAAKHPAWSLEQRKQGFGIGGGYERPYRARATGRTDSQTGLYGPIPHAGYYGANDPARRFSLGQATYRDEISWFRPQFGEKTSGSEDSR